jgi:hypothetical protein
MAKIEGKSKDDLGNTFKALLVDIDEDKED